MALTYAEFCAGYGGLGLAVEEVFGAELKWYSEFDAAPSKIMANHWPDIPNLGDMTQIDWNTVEAVDILSGGTPCQDLSAAGRRKGMTEGTRSNLWVHMREAIAVIKPRYVVWENVRGAYSAEASCDLEQCPGCVGDTSDGRVFLRALGRVLGDLSDLGYDCQWRGLRAGSDSNEGYGVTHAGSCHARFRVFVLATYRGRGGGPEGERAALEGEGGHGNPGVALKRSSRHQSVSDSEGLGWRQGRPEPARIQRGLHAPVGSDPSASNTRSSALRKHSGEPSEKEAWAASGNRSGDPYGERAPLDRRQTSPTPDSNSGDDDGWLTDSFWEQVRGAAAAWSSETNWGEYEPAIRRWEYIIGRPAPRPTEPTGRAGGHRLSPKFTEWMMGLPDGWVTGESEKQWRDRIQLRRCHGRKLPIGMRGSIARRGPLLSRNEQLKACGNGVVPQQAIAALRDMTNYSKEGGFDG